MNSGALQAPCGRRFACKLRHFTPRAPNSLRHRGRRGTRRRADVACGAFDVYSPSKVNLFLRILHRRNDGFHELASLFHVISLGDSLTFEPRSGGEDALKCNWEDVPTDGSNLVLRALDLFRKHTGAPLARTGTVRAAWAILRS